MAQRGFSDLLIREELSPYQTFPRTLTPFWPCRYSGFSWGDLTNGFCFSVSLCQSKHRSTLRVHKQLWSVPAQLKSREGHSFLPGSFLPQIRSLLHKLRAKNCKLDSEPILPQTAKSEQATWLLKGDAIRDEQKLLQPSYSKANCPSAQSISLKFTAQEQPGDLPAHDSALITSKAVSFKQRKVSFV